MQYRVDITTNEELLNYEEVLAVLKDIEHTDDVGMFGVHKNFELVHQQIIDRRLLGKQCFFENFEGKFLLTASCALDPAFEYLAKGAFAD